MRTVSLWINVTLAVIALGCLAASAQAASGLEPGVHVDPGSPAAKEYALPLNQARGTGSAPSSASPQTGSEGTLFGAGIKPPGSGGPSGGSGVAPRGSGGAAGSSGVPGSTGGQAAGPGAQPPLPQAVLRAAREQGSSSGVDGSTLALLGGAVAILVLGGFGGTVLRHSRRAT